MDTYARLEAWQRMRIAASLAATLIDSGCELSWRDADERGRDFARHLTDRDDLGGRMAERERLIDANQEARFGYRQPILLIGRHEWSHRGDPRRNGCCDLLDATLATIAASPGWDGSHATLIPTARCGRSDPHGAHTSARGWCGGNVNVVEAVES